MFLYNVHTPNKTFAVQYQQGQSFSSLLDRIANKSGLSAAEQAAFKGRKEGAGIVYEFGGERWSLEDDDDLAILHSRLPPTSSTGATLHLNPPSHHAHFASNPQLAPPAYSTASTTIKTRAQSAHSKAKATNKEKPSASVPTLSLNGGAGPLPQDRQASKAHSDIGKHEASAGETADGTKISKARSVMSTRSRKSKWGNDNAEPLGDVHKRKWLEFHANNGVRTVVGKVGNVDNVRMLLKSGYKQVYISRSFAVKAGLVPAKFGMGTMGYTGLKTLGNVPITVGSRTGHHQALISEEQHFDVILGRQWLERMAVKIDPLDQTALTYMDSGEVIPCDLVVLKDPEGNVITVT